MDEEERSKVESDAAGEIRYFDACRRNLPHPISMEWNPRNCFFFFSTDKLKHFTCSYIIADVHTPKYK